MAVLTTLAAYSFALLLCLLHVFSRRQLRVQKIRRNALLIAARLAVPFALLHAAFIALGVQPLIGYGVLVGIDLFLVPFVMVLVDGPPIIFGFCYLVGQWVLGWPDLSGEQWGRFAPTLNPMPVGNATSVKREPHPLEGLVGQQGVTCTRLSPSGKVCINGSTVTARTDGEFVAAGVDVVVTGLELGGVVVRPLATTSDLGGT